MTKHAKIALCLLVGLAAALVAAVEPAGAAREQEMVVTADKGRFSAEFGRIDGSFPALGTSDFDRARDPDTCNAANYCDTIPLKMIPPAGLAIADDVRVKLTLELVDPEECCPEPDLDLILWDNKQRKEDPAADETPYSIFARSAAPGPNEQIIFPNPDLDQYNLTVVAWLGPTAGYRITAEMIVDRGSQPFELLEPEGGDNFDDFEEGGGAPPELPESGGFGPGTLPPLPSDPFGGGLNTVGGDFDSNLDFDVPSLEDQLAGPAFDFEQAGSEEPLGTLSTAGMVATLLALPAIGAAFGGSWMMRRQNRFTL